MEFSELVQKFDSNTIIHPLLFKCLSHVCSEKTKNLDKSLSEAHILNGFQCCGKVGKVNVASIKAVSFLDFFFFWQRPGNIYKIIVMACVNSVSLSKL